LKTYRLLAVAALLGAAPPLFAHDLWIEPTSFSPAPGQLVGVRLRVGMNLAGDPVPRVPGLVNRFVVASTADRRPVLGREGADPAGTVRAVSGLQVIGYYSNPSWIELPGEIFNPYLKEEGLDSIIALRALRGETGAKARELYSRCAKSLVLSGSPDEAEGDRQLGFPLELVAERNPYALGEDKELPVRLTYENRPLEGALVVAINRVNPAEKFSLRSDREGRVRFRLKSGGMWLVKAVHMVPAPAESGAEWQSYWASLTFELSRGRARRLPA
jgi:uncharacterized GH25 family protein